MATLTEIVKSKAGLEAVMGDPSYLGYWEDLTGQILTGQTVSRNGDFWQAVELIPDVTVSAPNDSNDSWFKRQDAVYAFVVSQLSGGDSALVGYIYEGETIDGYEYLIYPPDGRVYSRGSVTGTITGQFNPSTGLANGLSGALILAENVNSLKSKTLAAGLTLIDYTSTKILDSDYQNSTGAPIIVSITVDVSTSVGGGSGIDLLIDGTSVATPTSQTISTNVSVFWVWLPGQTLRANSVNSVVLNRWVEVRV